MTGKIFDIIKELQHIISRDKNIINKCNQAKQEWLNEKFAQHRRSNCIIKIEEQAG